jgi:hypothetical protein
MGEKLTFRALQDMASSRNPDERKKAWALYQAWLKAAPQLAPDDRLNATQRNVLMQLFKSKGFTVGQQASAGQRTTRSSVPPTGQRRSPQRT